MQVRIHAGPEIGVASTKAFTTQITVLTMIALRLGKAKGTLSLSDSICICKN
jgi:glucosamine--fructose-6-phosphate aminotransferase (isomerizing)